MWPTCLWRRWPGSNWSERTRFLSSMRKQWRQTYRAFTLRGRPRAGHRRGIGFFWRIATFTSSGFWRRSFERHRHQLRNRWLSRRREQVGLRLVIEGGDRAAHGGDDQEVVVAKSLAIEGEEAEVNDRQCAGESARIFRPKPQRERDHHHHPHERKPPHRPRPLFAPVPVCPEEVT